MLSMKASDSFPVISKSGVLEWEETKKGKTSTTTKPTQIINKQETVKQDNNKTAKKVLRANNKEKKQRKT